MQDFLIVQKKHLEDLAQRNSYYQEEMKKLFREALFLEYEFWNKFYFDASVGSSLVAPLNIMFKKGLLGNVHFF